jgi:hypothetical protein
MRATRVTDTDPHSDQPLLDDAPLATPAAWHEPGEVYRIGRVGVSLSWGELAEETVRRVHYLATQAAAGWLSLRLSPQTRRAVTGSTASTESRSSPSVAPPSMSLPSRRRSSEVPASGETDLGKTPRTQALKVVSEARRGLWAALNCAHVSG